MCKGIQSIKRPFHDYPFTRSSKPSLGSQCLTLNICSSLGVHEQCYNQSVQTQHFGEDEDEDHANEEAGLLRCAADTGVADDADCEPGLEVSFAFRAMMVRSRVWLCK